ncbi:unnamed protein product [Vicia faba]|uniref:Uncharacterized protein n=1 Tax=Vicia faba TaxID=3906 RepID=A0AAV1AFI9_VICFA|nr:unnamed protein product [Vicia faba]
MFIHVGYEFSVTKRSIGMIQDFGLWIFYGIKIDSSRINTRGALRFLLRIHISSIQGYNPMLSPNCASAASYQSLSTCLGFNRRKPDGLVNTYVSIEEFPEEDENIRIEENNDSNKDNLLNQTRLCGICQG